MHPLTGYIIMPFSSVHHTVDLLSLDNTDYVDDGKASVRKGDEEYYDYRILIGLTDGFSSWSEGQWHDAGDSFMERRTVA